MIFIHAARNTDNRTSCILIPVRSAKSGKRRHHITPIGICYLGRHIFGIRRGIHQTHFIAQPLHGGACDKDRTFQRITDLPVQSPCNRCNQSILGKYRLFPCIQQQKAAGTICVFRFSGRKTGLSKQSCLLISGRAANRNRSAKKRRIRLRVNTAGRFWLRQHTFRNVQLP